MYVCMTYVPDNSVRNSSPIFTKFGTDHQDEELRTLSSGTEVIHTYMGGDEFHGGENWKSTSGFMRMLKICHF